MLICKKLGDDTLRVPVFDNMMLTDEHESHAGGIGDYEWWTLYYPFLSFYGEVVDHDCYEICRLSYCFWPSAPLGKGIARMQKNFRRNKKLRDHYLLQVFRNSGCRDWVDIHKYGKLILSFLPTITPCVVFEHCLDARGTN